MKTHKVGKRLEFSEEGYKEFVSLSKEEQIKKVAASYSPKDRQRAEKDLAHIPNGDSNAANKQTGKGSASTGNRNEQDNTAKPAADKS